MGLHATAEPWCNICPTTQEAQLLPRNHAVVHIIDAARIACAAGFMQRSVRPSVCLSHRSTAATAAGGFAAERPVGRTYRSTAAGAVMQRPVRVASC